MAEIAPAKALQASEPPTNGAGPEGWWRWVRVILGIGRYGIAAAVTGTALAALPLAATFVGAVLGVLLVLVSDLSFVVGEPLEGGLIQLVFWFIVAPLALLLLTAAAVLAILVAVTSYVVLGVLPLAWIVERVAGQCDDRRLSLRGLLTRLAGFGLSGAILGGVLGAAGLLLIHPETLSGGLAMFLGAVLVSVCAVLLFGLVLTLLHAVLAGLGRITGGQIGRGYQEVT
jgi:hypothetical protein